MQQPITEGKWKGKKVRYRMDRIIVKLKPVDDDSGATIEGVCDEICKNIPKGRLVRISRSTGRALFVLDSKVSVPHLSKELSKRNDVEYAEPDVVDTSTATKK